MTASASAAPINNFAAFNITATNSNSSDLSNVVITDVLPAGMAYGASATTLPNTVTVAGQTITWTIPSLPAGHTETLILAVQLTQQGTLFNYVTSPGANTVSASILVLPGAVTHYRMDEPVGSWIGSANDVIDSGGNGLNGHRRTTATPTTTNTVAPGFTKPSSDTIASEYPAVTGGGFCNAGYFDGNAVVETPSSPFFGFQQTLSASAWVFPFALPPGSGIGPNATGLYSILSNDTNYEFHLDPSGHLYWWWQASTLTSAQAIPINKWTHIAITMDASIGKEIIYIDGVPDVNTNNWKGTLAQNACPFYVGGDISTGTNCTLMPQRNFHGLIDEAKIYNYPLSAAEVKADMTLGRLCNGDFDHIEIDHNGGAAVCAPKTITLKACLDAKCTALYPGMVTVKLSPSGWLPNDTVTFTGGLAAATLSNFGINPTGNPPGITLDAVATTANSKTICLNTVNGTNTCFLYVDNSNSCKFDAIENNMPVDISHLPPRHIYTKLAGKSFSVDLVVLNADRRTINDKYSDTVTYELVDTTSNTQCSTLTALNVKTSIPFTSADAGRKAVTLTCCAPTANASPNVTVRMWDKTGTSCSSDTFAVRPSAVTLSNTYTGSSFDSGYKPTIKAGTLFNIGATTNPTAGYTGLLTLDQSKLAQVPASGTPGKLKLTAGFQVNPPSTSTSNTASYSEVGYFIANAGAFYDSSYTNVDQINQTPGCAATDTCDCLLSKTHYTNANVPDYLSDVLINGRYGCSIGNKTDYVPGQPTNVAFGRFIPDHFDTSVLLQGCVNAGPTNTFTYSGQPIPIQVTAKNGAAGTTLNYDTTLGFSKGVTLTSDATGNLLGSFSPSSIQANIFAQGATFPVQSPPAPQPFASAFSFKTPTKPTTIYLRAVEVNGDGVSSDRGATPNTNEGSAYIYSGRLRLISGQGSELAPFWMQAEVQYYDGTYWSTNINDSCTTYVAQNFGVSGTTSTAVGTKPGDVKSIKNGFGSFLLAAPSPTSRGFAKICLDLATTAKPDDCIAATPIGTLGYLRPAAGVDPFATVTFGGANSNSRGNWGYIYRRENF
jgi:uncharacterized repeat protein (TIGR01451 family)